MAATTEETPWHAAFPAPKIAAASISRDDILQWLQGQEHVAGRDFVLVDVRRADFEVYPLFFFFF
jgi:arsenical-resistance protein 2